jgi:hypothetical protein
MKRPRQHIIEDETHHQLMNIIPSNWVTRKLTPDYGLDYLVEIFRNGESTGTFFYIQLKGTDKNDLSGDIDLKLEIKYLQYYKSVDLPVLLVMASIASGKLWSIWANSLLETYEIPRKQKSVTIRFKSAQITTRETFSDLENRSFRNIFKTISINSKSVTGRALPLHNYFKKWLSHHYVNEIAYDDPLLPAQIIFTYEAVSQDTISLKISTPLSTCEFQFISLSGRDYSFLSYPEFDESIVYAPMADPFLFLAVELIEFNYKSTSKILTQVISLYREKNVPSGILLNLSQKIIEQKRIDLFERLSRALLHSQYYTLFQFFNASVLFFDRENDFIDIYQANLLLGIEVIDSDSIRAAMSYTLANSYRSAHSFVKAARYYLLARKYKQTYTESYYWWYEFAGVLFSLEHFKFAESFYKKSFQLEKKANAPMVHALIGDSLFFQGKFSFAKKHLEKYLDKNEAIVTEYQLKVAVCEFMIDEGLDTIQFNRKASYDLVNKVDKSDHLNDLYKAIKKDPLNGQAWFNYALLKQYSDIDKAFMSFLVVAVIQPWDIESWKNCFLLALNMRASNLIYLVSKGALEQHNNFINYISDHFLGDDSLTSEVKQKIVEGISVLLSIQNKNVQ